MSDAPLRTVLLVDDDPFSLALASKALASEDYRVLTADDPLRVPPLLEWEGVDVLVADIQMPQLNGVELMVRVRELFPHVIRILLTGSRDFETAVKAINDGAIFRYLTKPLDEPALRLTIRQAFERVESLRRLEAAEEATARRRRELGELEARHAGIATVSLVGGAYVVPDSRLAELVARFTGTALEGLHEP